MHTKAKNDLMIYKTVHNGVQFPLINLKSTWNQLCGSVSHPALNMPTLKYKLNHSNCVNPGRIITNFPGGFQINKWKYRNN